MRYRTYFELLLLGTLLLTSCVPLSTPSEPAPSATPHAQWDCAEVIDAKLEAFPFRSDGDAVSAWIQDQYGTKPTDIQSGPSANGTGYYHFWWVGQRRYEISRWLDAWESPLAKVSWAGQAPILAETLRCLGKPSLYRAFHAMNPEAIWTYLELWYPERGIMVTAYITRKTSHMTADQVVAYISYVQPGTPEELVTRFTGGIAPGSERYAQILQGLKPWPGDITQITIDERG